MANSFCQTTRRGWKEKKVEKCSNIYSFLFYKWYKHYQMANSNLDSGILKKIYYIYASKKKVREEKFFLFPVRWYCIKKGTTDFPFSNKNSCREVWIEPRNDIVEVFQIVKLILGLRTKLRKAILICFPVTTQELVKKLAHKTELFGRDSLCRMTKYRLPWLVGDN